MKRSSPLRIVLLLNLCAAVTVGAETTKPVAEWVAQLDSNKYAERQAATTQLNRLGKEAIQPLSDAILDGSGEVVTRGIEILVRLAGSPEVETSREAFESLQRIAASEKPISSKLAQRAVRDLQRRIGPGRMRGTVVAENQVRRRGNQFSLAVTNNNGDRKIDLTRNGERVTVASKATGQVSVTYHLPGGKTKTHQAASPEDLQKTSPEAFAKFQEVTKLADQGPIRVGALDALGRLGQMVGERPQPKNGDAERLGEIRGRLQKLLQDLENQQKNPLSDEELDRMEALLNDLEDHL